MSYIIPYFNVTNQAQLPLPISLFLVGYVLGPLFFAPLSETYGRKMVMLSSFIFFTSFTLACAVAPTWPVFLVFRTCAGVSASCAIAVVGGLYADIYNDPVSRGRAFALFMSVSILLLWSHICPDCTKCTALGPIVAPIISGFVSAVDWRWAFWVDLMIASFSLFAILFLPETYGPTILRRRAERIRKETGNTQIFAPIELEKKGARQMITVILFRPLRMFLFEPIVLFSCLYLSYAYAIFCKIH